jgi:hypothetical protein
MDRLDLLGLRKAALGNALGRGMTPAGRFLEQPSTSSAAIADSQNAFARQGLQAGALAEANRGMSNVEAANLRALKALGASQQPATGITKPKLITPTSAASGAGSLLPGRGTPGSAALGAFGQTMSQLGGWQDKPMTFGQILGTSLGKAREAYGTAEDRQRQIAAEEAAAKRQAEQDALTKRYRDAQIAQMQGKKEGGIKIGSIVKLPLKGDMIQDQMWDGTKFVNQGDPYSRFSPKADTNVTITQEAESESAKALARKGADYTYDQLGKYETQARSASELVEQYDTIQKTLESNPDLQTGVLQELFLPFQRLAASAGFLNDKDLKELQALETIQAKMAYIVPRMREEGSGSTSNFEMNVFKTAAPGLGKTRESNLLLAASARQAAQHRMNVQDERRKFVQENGRLPTSKELGDIVETQYGSMFKTPFGNSINRKSSDEVDQEFANMFNAGKINSGDVVYMGEEEGFVYVTNDILKAAGLI